MPLYARWSVTLATTLLSGCLGWVALSAPALSAPYYPLEQECNPKFAGTHDCLEPMPAYSYHLGLQSNYNGEICVGLGAWEGENKVVMEWDGLQTKLQLAGKAGVQQLLQPEPREGRSSAIVVYSDQPIMPRIVKRNCGRGRNTHQITIVSWPDGTDRSSVAHISEEEGAQASNL